MIQTFLRPSRIVQHQKVDLSSSFELVGAYQGSVSIMLRGLHIILFFLLFHGFSFAQDFSMSEREASLMDTERLQYWGAAGVTAGIALPLGPFAEKDVFNLKSGFADQGLNFNPINIHYRFSKYYGMAVNWSRSMLPLDINSQASGLTANLQGLSFTGAVEDPFRIDNIAIGIVASIPGPTFDLDFRIMGSVVRSVLPESDLNVRQSGAAGYTVTQLEAESIDLGYTLGMCARVHLAQSIDWFLQAEYFAANPSYELEFRYSFGGVQTDNQNLPVAVLGLTTGIGLRF